MFCQEKMKSFNQKLQTRKGIRSIIKVLHNNIGLQKPIFQQEQTRDDLLKQLNDVMKTQAYKNWIIKKRIQTGKITNPIPKISNFFKLLKESVSNIVQQGKQPLIDLFENVVQKVKSYKEIKLNQLLKNSYYLVEKIIETQKESSPFDFPMQVEYDEIDQEKLKLIHQKLYFTRYDALEKFKEEIENNISDARNVLIKNYETQINHQREERQFHKIKRSKHGQGNDLQDCDEIDNDLVYIPTSGQCLYKCSIKALYEQKQQANDLLMDFEKYAQKKGIVRHNFRYCDLKKLDKFLPKGYSYNYYRKDRKEWRYSLEKNQILVCLQDNHYFLIKDSNKAKEAIKFVQDNLIWRDKKLSNGSLENCEQIIKFHTCEEKDIYKNVYIFDLETYKKYDNWFQVYSCGFGSLDYLVKSKFNRKGVKIEIGKNSIMNMLNIIDSITQKKSIKIKKQKKEGMSLQITKQLKTNVYLYAHNASGFDSYFFLQLKDCKVTKMIQKGGIMTIQIDSDQFKNATFIVRDTCKFIKERLENMCKSYKVPDHLSKQKMNHEEITEFNYLEKKFEWYEYLENDVLSLSYIWDQFNQKMRSIMNINNKKVDLKEYCSISQLSYSFLCAKSGKQQKYFKDPVVRQFIQNANRGGRVIARKQEFKTKNIQQILQLNNVDSIDQLVGKVLKKESLQLIENDYQIAFDATSLYPSAMSLENASYLDPETTQFLNNEQCKNFNEKDYKKFIIECDLYIPTDLQFVPLSIKFNGNAQFSTGYYNHVFVNDIDLKECFRFGIKLLKVYQGIYSEPLQNYMRDFVIQLYNERAKVKDSDKCLGDLYKLILNSAYGKLGQKNIQTEIKFCEEKRFYERKFDDDVIDHFKLGNDQICYKKKKQENIGQQMSPNHIAGYVLAYSKQIMNNFILQMGADKENLIYYMDTDSFYIHSTIYEKYLANIKDQLGGGKNDYGKTKMIIQGHYIANKQKICYVLDTQTMKLEKKVTWKGISIEQFKQINQKTVQRVNQGNDYMNISQWTRDLQNGVQYGFQNINKMLSIQEYCKKYNLQNGVYEYQSIQACSQ